MRGMKYGHVYAKTAGGKVSLGANESCIGNFTCKNVDNEQVTFSRSLANEHMMGLVYSYSMFYNAVINRYTNFWRFFGFY